MSDYVPKHRGNDQLRVVNEMHLQPKGTITMYTKAILAAVIAALTALGTALTDGGVSPSEWVAVALAFFVALGAVYAVPNSPSGPTERRAAI